MGIENLLGVALDPWDELDHQVWVVIVHDIENFAKLEYHFVIFNLQGLATVCVSQANRNFQLLLVMLLQIT